MLWTMKWRAMCVACLLVVSTAAHATSVRIASPDDDYTVRATACPSGCGSTAWPPAFTLCSTNFIPTGTTVPSVVTQTVVNQGVYTLDELLLRWDTSFVPTGVTITGATLTVKVTVSNTNGYTLNGDWYNWDGSCDPTDLTFVTPTTAFFGQNISGWTQGSVQTITLSNLQNIATGPGAITYLRLSMTVTQPTDGANYLGIVDFAGDSSNAALLDITFTSVTATPTITRTITPTPSFTPVPVTPTRLPSYTSVPGGVPTYTPPPRCGEALPQ